MKNFFLIASFVGLLVPLSFFFSWLRQHGADAELMINTIVADRLSLFAWSDVVITALVLLVFIIAEGRRLGVDKLWLPVVGTCLVGPSFGLPLFLFLRACCLDGRSAKPTGLA